MVLNFGMPAQFKAASHSVEIGFRDRMPTSTVGGPVPTHARQGRQKQRYGEHGERLLAGCIPFRVNDSDPEDIKVLMVSRRLKDSLVFPKGGWEIDEATAEEAAKRETVEEAGVRGRLEGPLIGAFPFKSRKGSPRASKIKCIAYMYPLRVEEELDVWPEQAHRQRSWHSLEEACELCCHEWMRGALFSLIEQQGWQHLVDDVINKPKEEINTKNGCKG